MHILITGGQGYIGNHLTHAFLQAGHTVTTLDSGFAAKPSFDFSNYNGKLIRHQATVANPDAVARAMTGVNLVYHLADRSDHDSSARHPLRLAETNVQGTATVLAMARKAGVDKVIFTSSGQVYGNLVGAQPTDPCVPVNMYGASKLAAEALCRGFYQEGMEIVILRLYSVWGGSGSTSIVAKLAAGHDTLPIDGDQTRDFVYLRDVVAALMAAAHWDSNIYNIASGTEVTLNGLWHILNPEVAPRYIPSPNSEVYRECGDITNTPWRPGVLLADLSAAEIRRLCS